MQWANYDKAAGGKNAKHLDENDRQMAIFKELTKMGLRPWSALFNKDHVGKIKTEIQKLCKKHYIPEEKWLGRSQLRKIDETIAQMEQVCGVSVNFGLGNFFKSIGAFGSTSSTMK
jgi:hypothetical protein